jgi:hypothetical protein
MIQDNLLKIGQHISGNTVGECTESLIDEALSTVSDVHDLSMHIDNLIKDNNLTCSGRIHLISIAVGKIKQRTQGVNNE